jgi:hypothetical protein
MSYDRALQEPASCILTYALFSQPKMMAKRTFAGPLCTVPDKDT